MPLKAIHKAKLPKAYSQARGSYWKALLLSATWMYAMTVYLFVYIIPRIAFYIP